MTRSFSSADRKAGRAVAAKIQGQKRFEEAWCRQGHSIFDGVARRPEKYARKESGKNGSTKE